MLKMILSLSVLTLTATGFAAEIKITSWESVSNDVSNHVGEVCGLVTGGNGSEKVLVLADPGKHQGEYISLVSSTGKFCQLVATYNGEVDVSIMGSHTSAHAKK